MDDGPTSTPIRMGHHIVSSTCTEWTAVPAMRPAGRLRSWPFLTEACSGTRRPLGVCAVLIAWTDSAIRLAGPEK